GRAPSGRSSRMALVRRLPAMEAKNRNVRSPLWNRTSTSPARRATDASQPGSAFTSRTTTIGPCMTITTVPAPATGMTVGCTGGARVTGGRVTGGSGAGSVVGVVVAVGASVVVVVVVGASVV